MKTFLQNLLMFFALCLCGLIAFQWVRETDLRKNVQQLTDTVHDKSEAIQSLQAKVRTDEAEITRLDAVKNDLTATVKSNRLEISRLNTDLEKLQRENEKDEATIKNYKEALDTANTNILQQNDTIKTLNDEYKKLADDRNEVVKKYNSMASNYNGLVGKWNKLQEDLAKQATNAASRK